MNEDRYAVNYNPGFKEEGSVWTSLLTEKGMMFGGHRSPDNLLTQGRERLLAYETLGILGDMIRE